MFVDLAERKIPVQYAKQVKGRKMYGGQSSHIPLKVNALALCQSFLQQQSSHSQIL